MEKSLFALASHGKARAPQRARWPRTRGGAGGSRGTHRKCGLQTLRDADGVRNRVERHTTNFAIELGGKLAMTI